MIDEWLGIDPGELALTFVSAVAILAVAIATIRVIGLRSLAKMSSFDFVVTIALGSIMATAALTSTSLWTAALAFVALLSAQWLISTLRRRTGLDRAVDNDPLLLMSGPEMIAANLDHARVTEADVRAKLREANVTDHRQVLAVVLETTGDISVLHGAGPLDERLLVGVRRSPGRDAPSGH